MSAPTCDAEIRARKGPVRWKGCRAPAVVECSTHRGTLLRYCKRHSARAQKGRPDSAKPILAVD